MSRDDSLTNFLLTRRAAARLLVGSIAAGCAPRMLFAAESSQMPAPQPAGDIELLVGSGVDSLTGESRAPVIIRNDNLARQSMLRVHQEASIVTSYTELQEFLQVTASAKGKIYGATASAQSSFIDSKESRDYSICIAIFATAIASTAAVRVPQLDPQFIADMKIADEQEMFNKYGDQWISKVEYGGECLILLRHDAASRARQRSWAAEMKADAAGQGGTANLLRKIHQLSANKKLSVRTYYSGQLQSPPLGNATSLGSARVAEGTFDVDPLIKWLEGFGRNVASDGVQVPISVTMSSFNTATNWPVKSIPINLKDAREELGRLTAQRNLVVDRILAWSEFQDDPYYFAAAYTQTAEQKAKSELVALAQSHVASLRTVLPQIEKNIDCLKSSPIASKNGSKCAAPPSAEIPTDPSVLSLKVPPISFRMYRVKRDPASGSGREPLREGGTKVAAYEPSTEDNWLLPWGGRLEIIKLSIFWSPGEGLTRDDIRLLYRYNTADWIEASDGVWPNDREEYLRSIAFKLEGRLAPAYFIEYEGWAGNMQGRTVMAGNTERCNSAMGVAVGKDWQMESVRLAIWPRVWPAKSAKALLA